MTRLARATRRARRRFDVDALTAGRVDTGDPTWSGPVPDGIAGYPMGNRWQVGS